MWSTSSAGGESWMGGRRFDLSTSALVVRAPDGFSRLALVRVHRGRPPYPSPACPITQPAEGRSAVYRIHRLRRDRRERVLSSYQPLCMRARWRVLEDFSPGAPSSGRSHQNPSCWLFVLAQSGKAMLRRCPATSAFQYFSSTPCEEGSDTTSLGLLC